MSDIKSISRLIGGDQKKRKANDFYETPSYAIDYILDRVEFEGSVWEPSCGRGAISEKLLTRGYKVLSTDLIDHGYGTPEINFLQSDLKYDNIMTNPPFNISTKYTLKSLELAERKVLLLNKLTFLEGKVRGEKIFKLNKLKEVHVFSSRLSFGENKKGGMLAFAWFLFDQEHNDQPKVYWT